MRFLILALLFSCSGPDGSTDVDEDTDTDSDTDTDADSDTDTDTDSDTDTDPPDPGRGLLYVALAAPAGDSVIGWYLNEQQEWTLIDGAPWTTDRGSRIANGRFDLIAYDNALYLSHNLEEGIHGFDIGEANDLTPLPGNPAYSWRPVRSLTIANAQVYGCTGEYVVGFNREASGDLSPLDENPFRQQGGCTDVIGHPLEPYLISAQAGRLISQEIITGDPGLPFFTDNDEVTNPSLWAIHPSGDYAFLRDEGRVHQLIHNLSPQLMLPNLDGPLLLPNGSAIAISHRGHALYTTTDRGALYAARVTGDGRLEPWAADNPMATRPGITSLSVTPGDDYLIGVSTDDDVLILWDLAPDGRVLGSTTLENPFPEHGKLGPAVSL